MLYKFDLCCQRKINRVSENFNFYVHSLTNENIVYVEQLLLLDVFCIYFDN